MGGGVSTERWGDDWGDDEELSIRIIRYIDEAKEVADRICDEVGECRHWSGEPLPAQLRRILAAVQSGHA
jgi:hypothetical protein